jgi:queuosine precursor transporter
MSSQKTGYLDIITGLFVAVLIISNLASTKIVDVGGFLFDGGTILFPLAYIFGDILTEVYGYARARRVIWIGFGSLLLTVATLAIVQYLPAAGDWPNQEAYEAIIGFVPRIALASMAAYLVGEFLNAYVLAKMKVRSKGRHLWQRLLGSTVAGQGVDTVVFTLIAFGGTLPGSALLNIILTVFVMKVAVEVLLLPVTYRVVAALKRSEGLDAYDKKIDFTPLKLSE